MFGWLIHWNAIAIVRLLFWASALTASWSFAADRFAHSILRRHWKLILASLILVLIWRIPFEGGFFHGMEYEDSYVYTVAARQIANHTVIEPSADTLPYSVSVCAVGSLIACQQYDNYPEHFIGDAYVLSLFSHILGYRPSIGSAVNIACACLAEVLIFLICMIISDDVLVAGFAALVFAITPVFSVYGLETSAEPVSNVCMTLVLWFCLRFVRSSSVRLPRTSVLVTWCAFTATLLLTLTIKRENILLAIALPAIAFLTQAAQGEAEKQSAKRWWILLSASLALAFSIQMRVLQTMSGETALFKKFPFSFDGLLGLLPVFLRSFFVFQWYGGAVILVAIGAILAIRRKNLSLFPLLLLTLYVALYAFHIRSYYEMRSGNTDPITALRFSMNLMSLWSISAGFGAAFLLEHLRRKNFYINRHPIFKWAASGSLLVVLIASYSTTKNFRDDAVEDEFRMRIEPSMAASQLIADDQSKPGYIVTLEPLIIQMYGSPNANILSLYFIEDSVMNKIGFSKGKTNVVYVDEMIHRNDADTERYGSQLSYLGNLKHETVMSNTVFFIVKFSPIMSLKNGLPQNN